MTGALSNGTLTAYGTVITGVAAVFGLGLTIYLSQRERRSREREPQVGAAVAVLAELEAVERGLSDLWRRRPGAFPGVDFEDKRQGALEARDTIERLLVPQIHHKQVQQRLQHLCEMVHQIAYGSLATEVKPESPVRNRIQTDVDNYLGYVRRTMNAFIGERSLPSEKAPPMLRREDDYAWEPPDVG